jgi:hypothetical protein
LDYTEKNRGWVIELSGRSKDYRADAGFARRVNTNNIFFANRFSTEPKPKAKIIRIDWRQFARFNYNWQGLSTDALFGTNFGFSLQRNTSVSIETGVSYERIFEDEFGLRRSLSRSGAFFGESERSSWQQYGNINFNTSPVKKISVGVFLGTTNNAFDFDFGGGNRFPRISPSALTGTGQLDPGAGRQINIGVGVEYRPIDPLRVSLDYNKSRLRRLDNGRTAFDSNLITLRSTYQFTRFTFTRLRLDYNSLSSNVSGQFLVGWNPSPGTAFYVGYNDNFNYNGFNPYNGRLEPRFERNSRTFFIRVSRLFRRSFSS